MHRIIGCCNILRIQSPTDRDTHKILEKMMKRLKTLAAFCMPLGAVALCGCDNAATDVDGTVDSAADAVTDTVDGVDGAVDAAADTVTDAVDAAADTVTDAVDAAVETVAPVED